MITPRWMYLAVSLLACAMVPISVLSYPVPSVGRTTQLEDTTRQPQIFRRVSQAKRKRPKSSSPDAGPSNPPAQHRAPNPQTPSPDGSPRRGPMDFYPSAHAPTRFKSVQGISRQASNIRSGTLKEETRKYVEKTKEAHRTTDWAAGKHDADHILEAQTVASKINKHKGSVNIKKACIEAIRTPLNEVSNLAPLHHKLNSKKNSIVAAIAKHDKYNHEFGPGRKANGKKGNKKNPQSKETLEPIPDFTHGVKKHILDHQVQMMETAKKVDAAIASDHCKELHKTKLYTENGKVTAQARIIIAHAKKSAGLPDHDLD